MPLLRLHPSLQRLIPRANASPILLADLESLFLTSRQCSEKYQKTIPEILGTGNPDEPNGFEQGMMWFGFKNDKPPDESIFGDNEEEKEERWKKDWLDRMERRESVYLDQFSCVMLTTSKSPGPDPLTPVPAVPSHILPRRSASRGHVRFSQETETAEPAIDTLP